MVVVTAETQWRLVGARWLVGKCSVPDRCHVLTSSGGASVSLRFKFNKRETQKQKLFKMFFCGFGPPSLVFLTVKIHLSWEHTKFLYPACCTIQLLFCTFFCVSALSIRLQFGGKAMFGVPGCFSKCNMLQRWGNLQLYMRQREPQFHHEIKPIAVDFQMFHLQELPGCEITPLRNIMRHTWHPGEEKRHAKLVAARKHLTGLKCALILFSNVILLPVFCFFLWNPLLVHCSNATKPAQFFLCLDFGSPRVFVDCPVPSQIWDGHLTNINWVGKHLDNLKI